MQPMMAEQQVRADGPRCQRRGSNCEHRDLPQHATDAATLRPIESVNGTTEQCRESSEHEEQERPAFESDRIGRASRNQPRKRGALHKQPVVGQRHIGLGHDGLHDFERVQNALRLSAASVWNTSRG
jgi:hypothetical protein